jgi:metal-responsive CopG/Arc/MetJ family transcriptional regulator
MKMKIRRVLMSINFDPDVKKMLDDYATKACVSRSQAVNDIIKIAIRNQINIVARAIGKNEKGIDPYSLTIREVLDRFSEKRVKKG